MGTSSVWSKCSLAKVLLKTTRQNDPKQRIRKEGSELVRAHLDYFTHFWKPHFQRDIDKWEHVQRRMRRMVKELKTVASEVQLNESGMWLRRPERVVHIYWKGCHVEKAVWYNSLVKRMWTLASGQPGSNFNSATYWLCDLDQVSQLLWTLFFMFIKNRGI